MQIYGGCDCISCDDQRKQNQRPPQPSLADVAGGKANLKRRFCSESSICCVHLANPTHCRCVPTFSHGSDCQCDPVHVSPSTLQKVHAVLTLTVTASVTEHKNTAAVTEHKNTAAVTEHKNTAAVTEHKNTVVTGNKKKRVKNAADNEDGAHEAIRAKLSKLEEEPESMGAAVNHLEKTGFSLCFTNLTPSAHTSPAHALETILKLLNFPDDKVGAYRADIKNAYFQLRRGTNRMTVPCNLIVTFLRSTTSGAILQGFRSAKSLQINGSPLHTRCFPKMTTEENKLRKEAMKTRDRLINKLGASAVGAVIGSDHIYVNNTKIKICDAITKHLS